MFASGKKNSSYKGLKKTYKGSQYQFDIFLLIFQPTYSDPFDFLGGVPAPAAGWGPAGTERGGVSMAGGREGQGARKGNGVRGHRLPSPPCFVKILLMYLGFLSR